LMLPSGSSKFQYTRCGPSMKQHFFADAISKTEPPWNRHGGDWFGSPSGKAIGVEQTRGVIIDI
jgi:hypothetical protein